MCVCQSVGLRQPKNKRKHKRNNALRISPAPHPPHPHGTHTHAYALSLIHILTHTHTHTHSLSLSLSLSLSAFSLTSETSKRLRGRSDRRGLQLSVRCSATTAPQALQSLDSKSSSSSEAMENSGFRGREHKSGCRRCPNHAPSLRSHLDRHNKAAAVPRTKGVTNVVMAAAASMVQKHKTTAHVPVLHCHGIGEACWGGV